MVRHTTGVKIMDYSYFHLNTFRLGTVAASQGHGDFRIHFDGSVECYGIPDGLRPISKRDLRKWISNTWARHDRPSPKLSGRYPDYYLD